MCCPSRQSWHRRDPLADLALICKFGGIGINVPRYPPHQDDCLALVRLGVPTALAMNPCRLKRRRSAACGRGLPACRGASSQPARLAARC